MLKFLSNRTHHITAGLGILSLGCALQAGAACVNTDQFQPTSGAADGRFAPAVYSPGESFAFRQVSESEADIVGLWQFKMTGFSVDYGTQAWHADGTEIMFSAGQNPQTGDVCQGVWRQVGHDTYTLNHIAMAWVAPGAGFGLRIHFHAVVKLDAGHRSFKGSYKAAVYSVGPANPFDESVKVAEGTGDVTGSRVMPD
jgi:hypothetical protein